MKLTQLAPALVAVLAISALTASAASANYQSSSSPVNISGSQNGKHQFKVDGQVVECNVANFTRNALTTPANEVNALVGSFSNCTAFGFASATVNTGSCHWKLEATFPILNAKVTFTCGSNANDNEGENTGDARVFSTVFGSECEVHVESQSNKTGVSFQNNTPVAGDFRMVEAVSGLTAEKTKDNGLCPLSGTGVTNNSTYNGNTDFTGNGAITLTVN